MSENKKYKKSIFIFRRDLRLEDNTGLLEALNTSKEVIPIFIFDPRQKDKKLNPYFSENAFQFLIESLKELDEELKSIGSRLFVFEGVQEEVLSKLIDEFKNNKEGKIEALFSNIDYTPFAILRDQKISQLCEENSVEFNTFHDLLLHDPKDTLKSDGTSYSVFTAYYNNANKLPVRTPTKNKFKNYYTSKSKMKDEIELNSISYFDNPNILLRGGRTLGIKILKNISKYDKYYNVRDYPSLDGTTKLSAHHKFGTISIRESYFAVEHNEMLMRQLYWRDFYTMIAFYNPKVFGHAFQDKYEKVNWICDEKNKNFIAWCNGETGFPIVDAGMRELNTTGYMHNRVRMIVSSFLTKDLHIDWRLGEKYFATKLIDYDPCVNNGSWQWSASTGCDAQPYFRIFNPWLQQEKFDQTCEYIKKWIPELKDLDSKTINNLHKQRPLQELNYPKPIVNHSVESKIAVENFKI